VRKLGLARTVLPAEYRADRVARELEALLSDASYGERAAAAAKIVREGRGTEAAADVIERLFV
jgi:UDP:flavonoid glycosyltransferase YjiC (YdhE family)